MQWPPATNISMKTKPSTRPQDIKPLKINRTRPESPCPIASPINASPALANPSAAKLIIICSCIKRLLPARAELPNLTLKDVKSVTMVIMQMDRSTTFPFNEASFKSRWDWKNQGPIDGRPPWRPPSTLQPRQLLRNSWNLDDAKGKGQVVRHSGSSCHSDNAIVQDIAKTNAQRSVGKVQNQIRSQGQVRSLHVDQPCLHHIVGQCCWRPQNPHLKVAPRLLQRFGTRLMQHIAKNQRGQRLPDDAQQGNPPRCPAALPAPHRPWVSASSFAPIAWEMTPPKPIRRKLKTTISGL